MRPLEDRPDLVKYVDGEPVLSFKAMAYLCGITEDEIQTEYDRQGGPTSFIFPKAWLQQGKTNAARLGTESMAEALVILAAEREAQLN